MIFKKCFLDVKFSQRIVIKIVIVIFLLFVYFINIYVECLFCVRDWVVRTIFMEILVVRVFVFKEIKIQGESCIILVQLEILVNMKNVI